MTIDEQYTQPFLTLLRKTLKGNGIRSDNVNIKSFNASTLEFAAATHIKLHNQISEKTLPGKATGATIFPNRQLAHTEAQNHITAALQDPAAIGQIKNIINEEPHNGFGLDNKSIKLPFLNREFISHDPCNPCHAKGLIPCAKCKGKGYEPCFHCNAQGFEKCNECNGNRQIRGPQGQMQTCNLCQGLGKTSCSFCRENRQIQCSICKTKGETQCKSCGGQGAQSNIVSAEITAQCAYSFDESTLPEKATAIIKNMGADLAKEAQITQTTKENEDNKNNEDNEQETLHLHYQVRVPQGDAEISIKDKTIKAYLFGKQATAKEIPNFLDNILAPSINKLTKAANGQGNLNENIRAAIKYKTTRQAITLSTRYNPQKAMKALLHYTPIGLSTQTAQKLIEDANTALNNATKQQRIIAIIAGALSAIALSALYLLSPLHPALLAQIPNTSLHMPLNIAALGLCATIGYAIWQTISSRARKQALENFIPRSKQ